MSSFLVRTATGHRYTTDPSKHSKRAFTPTRNHHTMDLSQNRNHEIPIQSRDSLELTAKVRTLRSLTKMFRCPRTWGVSLLVAFLFLASTARGAAAAIHGYEAVSAKCIDKGGYQKLMDGDCNIKFPPGVQRKETIAVLWGAVWHTVKKHHKTLTFVVPDKSENFGKCPNSTDAHTIKAYMIPVGTAMEQLRELGEDGLPMLKLLTTLNCSHVICLREFKDKKPTWTAAFHEETPGAYVCNIGSGQTEGYASKYNLEDASKFDYYVMTEEYEKDGKEAAKKACKDFSAPAYRKTENLEAVAGRIAATLVAVHKANQTTPIIARGTGKHRQDNGPANFTKLIETILAKAKTEIAKANTEAKLAKKTPLLSYKNFKKIFDSDLLPGDDEARFGGRSICDLLGPVVRGVQDVTTILSIESGKGSTQYAFWFQTLKGQFVKAGTAPGMWDTREYRIYANGMLKYNKVDIFADNRRGWFLKKLRRDDDGELDFGKTSTIEEIKNYKRTGKPVIKITTGGYNLFGENNTYIRTDNTTFFSHLSAVYTHLGDKDSLGKLHDAMEALGVPVLKSVRDRAPTAFARPDGTGEFVSDHSSLSRGPTMYHQASTGSLSSRRRRMAQREFSNRRDSPVMVRLLQQIIAAQDD